MRIFEGFYIRSGGKVGVMKIFGPAEDVSKIKELKLLGVQNITELLNKET